MYLPINVVHTQMKRKTELLEKISFPQLWTVRATRKLYADNAAQGLELWSKSTTCIH